MNCGKEKDYKKGYHEALRKAFKSITDLNYSYEPVKELVVQETQVEKEKLEREKKKNESGE